MKRLIGLLIVLLIFMFSMESWALGSCTETTEYRSKYNGMVVKKIACTGDASNGTVPNQTITIDGWIEKVETDPGATAPTTLYDLVLNTTAGVDMMGGELGDRSATVSEVARPKADVTYGTDYVDTVTMVTTNQTDVDALFDVYIWIYTHVPVSFY
ncbi:hypothetical protein LCGC14_1245250 [marine sediment metagenome]|uniref:Uncharacterized protein n=1 Tax=marine sediment metagenome TaxID=412755 RepID=A0A0F9P8R4_9ZZZZ